MDYKLAVALVKRYRAYKIVLIIVSTLLLVASGCLLGYGFSTYGWNGIVPLKLSIPTIVITVFAFMFSFLFVIDWVLNSYPLHFLTHTDRKLYFEALKLIAKIEREEKEKEEQSQRELEQKFKYMIAKNNERNKAVDYIIENMDALEALLATTKTKSALDKKLDERKPKFAIGDKVHAKSKADTKYIYDVKEIIETPNYGFIYGFQYDGEKYKWFMLEKDIVKAKK